MQVRIFFGLSSPDGPVSDEEWVRFLADVVTPRFPSGLTVVGATGQWRSAGRDAITMERSQVVEIVLDHSPEADRRVHEVVDTYRQRYRQESVLVTRQRLEVCF